MRYNVKKLQFLWFFAVLFLSDYLEIVGRRRYMTRIL